MVHFRAILILPSLFFGSLAFGSEVLKRQIEVTPTSCSGTTNLSCPSTVAGSLTSTDCAAQNGGWLDQFAITLPEQPFTASVSGPSSLPLLLVLVDPIDGSIFRSSSGFGGTSISYTPPDPGLVYTLVVATTSGAGGSYNLTVTCGSTSTCDWSGTLACGSEVAGATAVGECPSSNGRFFYDYYKLPLMKGDVVEISVSSSTPTYVAVDEPSFTAGLYSDDGDGGQVLVFTAAQDGVHQVAVTRSDALLTASYSLRVTCLSSSCGRTRAIRH